MPSPIELRRLNAIVLAIYWTALLVGTHWPHLPAFGPPNTDKVLHVTAYCGLSLLLSLYITGGRKATWRQLGLVVLILALAGGLDELTQPPFQRTADWYDWFADLAGITVGVVLAAWLGLPLYRRLANRGVERDSQ